MKLSAVQRLLAQLALQLTTSDLDDLKFQCHNLNQVQKDQATSAIRLFDVLMQASGNTETFLATLEGLFSEIEHFEKYLTIVQTFRRNIVQELPREKPPRPSQNVSAEQKRRFRKTLSYISARMQRNKLEIMVALSPLPRGCKDGLKEGFKLFEELRQGGFITENDVELLEEFFDVLLMKEATDLLYQYKTQMVEGPLHSHANPLDATPPSWSPFPSQPSSLAVHPFMASGSHSIPSSTNLRLNQVSPPPDFSLTPSPTATFLKRLPGDSLETPPPKRHQLIGRAPDPEGYSLPSPAPPMGGPPRSSGHTPSLPPRPAEPSSQQLSSVEAGGRWELPSTGELPPTGQSRGLAPTCENPPSTQLPHQAATESLHHRAGQVGVACSPSPSPLPPWSDPRHEATPSTATPGGGASNTTPLQPHLPMQSCPQHQEPPCRQDSQQANGRSEAANGLHLCCAERSQGAMESYESRSSPLATGSSPTLPQDGGNVFTSGEIGRFCRPELKNFTTIPSGEIVRLHRAQSNKETTMTSRVHEEEATSSGQAGEKRHLGHSFSCPGNVSTKAPVHGAGGNSVLTSVEMMHHLPGTTHPATTHPGTTQLGRGGEMNHQESTGENGTGDEEGSLQVELGEENILQAEETGDEGGPQTGGAGDEVPQAMEGDQVVSEQSPSISIGAFAFSSLKSFVASVGSVLSSSD